MFLGTPVMPDLTSLITTGLYINDLSMHDFSRDLMLAGTQQSVELKLALDQEQQKSKKLEESMRKLDEEMRRTDELLYQMIPKQVADRLRRGENPIDTCEVRLLQNSSHGCRSSESNMNINPTADVRQCVYIILGYSHVYGDLQSHYAHGSGIDAECHVLNLRYAHRA